MTTNRKILLFENPHMLSTYLIKKWTQLAEESITYRNRFTVALSGGRTPAEFYTKLAGLDNLELWEKTHIFLADERFVPSDDQDNNFKMIKRNLLDHVSIPRENQHPVDTSVENAGISAEHYKQDLAKLFSFEKNNLPRFDLVLLGMGDDGHTASIFPGAQGADDPNRLTMPVSLNHLKHDRISLTLSVINNAYHTFFLVLGEQKADIIKNVIDNHKPCPASMVNPLEGDLTFLLDRGSASKLTNPGQYLFHDEAMVT